MKQMIAIKVDVSKIDRTKLFEGKNGTKYLDIILMESVNDKYGNDWMAVQGISREERAKGVRGAILGNGKNLGSPRPRQEEDTSGVPF